MLVHFFVIVYTKDTCVVYDIKNEIYETGSRYFHIVPD